MKYKKYLLCAAIIAVVGILHIKNAHTFGDTDYLDSGSSQNNTLSTTVPPNKEVELSENIPEGALSRSNFNCVWKLPSDQKIIDMANDILAKKLWVLDTFPCLSYESIETLDWDIQFSDSPNTFQLHLQSLNSIVYLTKAYEINKNDKYLDAAEDLLLSWNQYRQREGASNNPFVWYDHGSALRAENIIYYCLVASENNHLSGETEQIIYDLIQIHASFLVDETHYTKNHNHGIFQDRALIYCAYFLNNEDSEAYLSLAKERLEIQKEFAFSSEMVHVENSPGYAIGVMDLFRVISEFLQQFNDPFGMELYHDITLAAEFMAYITKPNGLIAEVGDTNSSLDSSSISDAKMSIFGNEHLTYASSQGKQGAKPENTAAFYPKSGYYISHNSWEPEKYDKATWQMFKSGYSSKTHKHADDNSFMLYSKGYDIFVDPGWYNYMSGDPYRDYFVSASAHNTVIVDGKSYSPTEANSSKVGIYQWENNGNYDYVLGFNEMYPDVNFDRHFYNLGDAILLYDNIAADAEHTYTQLFHTSEAMELLNQSSDETLFKLADSGFYVRIKQLIPGGTNKIIRGDFKKERLGYISREMGHLDSIQTVIYEVVGKNVDILTLITIEDENRNVLGLHQIEYDDALKTLRLEKSDGSMIEISPKPRKRIYAEQVDTTAIDNTTFLFTNQNIPEVEEKNWQYAWYIIDSASADVLHKTDYTFNNTFEYCFQGEGTYFVKSYIRASNGQYRTSGLVAAIQYDENTHSYFDVTDSYPFLNLKYHGQSMTHLQDNTYQFNVNYDYSWQSQIRWYIYKNGGYYTVFTTKNQKDMIYSFQEPGTYTVMYYLTTPNGDNEFWNFEEILIE